MDGKLCVWGADRRTCVDLAGHGKSVTKVLADKQYNVAFSCGYDGKVMLWNLSNARSSSSMPPVAVYDGHRAPVLECGYGGGFMASGTRDGTVFLWDVNTGDLLQKSPGHKGQVSALEILPESPLFLTGGTDGFVKVWDPRTGGSGAVMSLPVHASQSKGVSAALACMVTLKSRGGGDVSTLVTGGSDNAIVVLDIRSNYDQIHRWVNHQNCVYTMLAVGESCVFSGDGMGMMLCYDVLGGGLKYGLGASQNSAVKGIFCVKDSIVTAGEDGKVLVFDY